MRIKNTSRHTSLAVLLVIPALVAFVSNAVYPSDILSFYDEFKITLGDGSTVSSLIDYKHDDYFFTGNDGSDWVVYKTPNSGGTTPNSSNTRSELRHLPEWTPETGGLLTGSLKVMQVSTTGDARVPASFSVVIGQIHSDEGHKNEPLKIFYKKFPGHSRGSVFWNYEINTQGDNSERWDFSTAVWGHDWSVLGSEASTYPAEPEDGIELGEEFSYEINVYQGVMYLRFESEGHPTVTFEKDMLTSAYTDYSDIPEQVLNVFSSTGQDGTEQEFAYAGELQYFKQGSYNQGNGKDPEDHMVWNTGSETYGGDLSDQYANGSYAEVWFRAATVGQGYDPDPQGVMDHDHGSLGVFPNPVRSQLKLQLNKHQIQALQLVNLQGQCVRSLQGLSNSEVQLDMSSLPAGSYLLVVEDSFGTRSSKQIVKR